MRRSVSLIVPLVLCFGAGCTDWPDLDLPDEGDGSYPALVTDEELARAGEATLEESAEATERLEARAASLRARAAVLSIPAEDQEALDEIRRRLAALPG
jgi:hypothetical protein